MTSNEAIDLAKQFATERGWPWLEPVRVTGKRRWFRLRGWIVYSSSNTLGGNVQIEIDNATASVTNAAYLPR